MDSLHKGSTISAHQPGQSVNIHIESDGDVLIDGKVVGRSEANGKREHVFAAAALGRREIMPVGWCSNVPLTVSDSGTVDDMRIYSFSAGDVYYEHWHIGHWVDFSKKSGLVDFDLHFCNMTTDTGSTTFRLSMWHLKPGDILDSRGAADTIYDIIFTFSSGTAKLFGVAYVENAMDMSGWDTGRTTHDGMLLKLERLSAGDTKAGDVGVIHNEQWYPTNGLQD